MRLYQNLLLALAILVALSSIASAQNPAVRSLRSGTDEERGFIDKLSAELSIFKLNRAARQKMTPTEKLAEKHAKETAKRAEAALKASNKKSEAVKKALQKQADEAVKAQAKADKLKAKQLAAMEKLNTKELAKKAAAVDKQDDMYNGLLKAKVTPEKLEERFQPGFDALVKKGIDPTTSENFKHLQNYWTIYYNRYPDKMKVALKSLSTAT
ncbi:hypothetical protein DVH05_001773 [Phytophthora capsici]|nr:hypothetical protein DVH05_001773 [Phytophthora capsici]